jgi:hypothetical protein
MVNTFDYSNLPQSTAFYSIYSIPSLLSALFRLCPFDSIFFASPPHPRFRLVHYVLGRQVMHFPQLNFTHNL